MALEGYDYTNKVMRWISVDSSGKLIGTFDQGSANADPAQSWWVALTDKDGNPTDASHPVPVTIESDASGLLAKDATLTGGTAKAIIRGGAKGGTAAADVTSTANGADHQGADVVEQFAPAYEDNTAGRALVEQRNSFANITSATTTTVKSGAGFLHTITINKGVTSATITIYDNTSGSGTKIGTITFGGSLVSDPPYTAEYDVSFATGLTIVTSGATDITVSYR